MISFLKLFYIIKSLQVIEKEPLPFILTIHIFNKNNVMLLLQLKILLNTKIPVFKQEHTQIYTRHNFDSYFL